MLKFFDVLTSIRSINRHMAFSSGADHPWIMTYDDCVLIWEIYGKYAILLRENVLG